MPMVDTTAFSGLVTNGIIPLGGSGTETAATATGKASSSDGGMIRVSRGLVVVGVGVFVMFWGFW